MDALSSGSTPSGTAAGLTSLRGSLGNPQEFFYQPVADQAVAFERIERTRAGLTVAAVQELMTELALTATQAARLLGMPPRTLNRQLRAPGLAPPLAPDETERVLLLRELRAWGVSIFADAEKFNRWLRRPLAVLEGQTPLALLDTSTGIQLVEQTLGRLAYGVYS